MIANLQPGTKVRVRSDLRDDGTNYHMSNSTKSDVANKDMILEAGGIVTIKLITSNGKYNIREASGSWTDEMFSEIISLPDEVQPNFKVGDIVECISKDPEFKTEYGCYFTVTEVMPNWSKGMTHLRVSPEISNKSTPMEKYFKLVVQPKLEPSTKRNLAFYKRSGKSWTKEEVHNINKYCGDCNGPAAITGLYYIFDDGMDNDFMHDWYQQKNHPNFSNCKQVAYEDVFPTTQEVNNPFKVGDRIRSILTDNPVDRPYGKEFTVVKVYEEEVYYKDGFAAHYSKFELVNKASDKPAKSSIEVGSHWERSYISGAGIAEEIIRVDLVEDNKVYWHDYNKSLKLREFFDTFTPRPDIDNQQLGKSAQVESTNQTIKEQPMTIQQLLQTLFDAEKPTTDYDKRPAILVVAYNRDGSQMGQAIADNIDQVKDKVADTPELWGCKVLTYTLDQEVSVDVPVKATKVKAAKPTKE